MSDKTEVATKVEATVNQCSFISSADVVAFEVEGDDLEVTLSISSAVEEGDDEADEASPSNSSAVDEGEADDDEEQSSPSNSSAVDKGTTYPEGDEAEFKCPLCGDYEGSKAQVSGHKAHCDSTGSSGEGEENNTSSSNSSAVDKEEVPHPEEADNPTKENYKVHYGVCCKEGCDYGTNGEDEDFCASHQNSSAVKEGSTEKSYDNLTEGQKAAAQDLLTSGEVDSLEEAVQMV